jgi:hypothetical protein
MEIRKEEKAQPSSSLWGCDGCAFNLQVLALPAKVALDRNPELLAEYKMAEQAFLSSS